MLSLSLLALSQSAAVPAMAECRILAAVDGPRIMQVMFDCPDDVADAQDLQDHADAVAAQFGVPIDTRALRIGWAASTVTFTDTSTGWQLVEPALFLSSPPRYVPRAAARGLAARCDMRIELEPIGAPHDIATACQAFSSSGRPVRQSGFEAEAEAAAERSRWFAPLDPEAACDNYTLNFQLDPSSAGADRSHFERPVDGAPTCS